MTNIAILIFYNSLFGALVSGDLSFHCDVDERRFDRVAPDPPVILDWRIERGEPNEKLWMWIEDQEIGELYFTIKAIPEDYSGATDLGYYIFVKGGQPPPEDSIPNYPFSNFFRGELVTNWYDPPSSDRVYFNTDVAIAAVDKACNYSKLSNIVHLSDSSIGCSATSAASDISPIFLLFYIVRVLTTRWSGTLRASSNGQLRRQ